MSIQNPSKGSIVFKLIIVLLIGVLIYVLYEPYVIFEQEIYYKAESRLRMENIRVAQLKFISDPKGVGKYNNSLDSLILYIKAGLESGTLKKEEFKPLTSGTFVPESLARTPKSWVPYMLATVDTAVIKKYVLECPDGYGTIGSLTEEEKLNKADWEN